MIKSFIFFLVGLLIFSKSVLADEGMWLPNLIKAFNYSDMKSKGLMISAEDLYSANKASVKDAIVHFNGGCTAELISKKGLLVTNHHCGYSIIANHSSVEQDYLKDGFWSKNYSEELPSKSLYVDFIIKIEDVTDQIIPLGNETGRQKQINIAKTVKVLTNGSKYQAIVKPFNYGTKYFAFIYERYTDIRLVGAPPSSIGKFGYDTDNWVWPRHTGDFALFRIYAGKNNKPAAYSKENKPYVPKYHLPISLEGIKPGDFAMVYGFPGTTEQHLTSYAIEQKLNITNPARIAMREKSLQAINSARNQNAKLKIKLARLQSSISNYWKKFKGESFGLKQEKIIAKKQRFENEFSSTINSTPKLKAKYGHILPDLKKAYANINEHVKIYYTIFELIYSGYIGYRNDRINPLIDYFYEKKNEKEFIKIIKLYKNLAIQNPEYEAFFPNLVYNITHQYMLTINKKYFPKILKQDNVTTTNLRSWVNDGFSTSVYGYDTTHQNCLINAKPKKRVKMLERDKIFQLGLGINEILNSILGEFRLNRVKIDGLMQQYVKAIEEVFPDKKHWYDANGTLRISYGNITGSSPKDGMMYKYYSTTNGILQKYIPGDKEFDVPPKLIELIKAKDFSPYSKDTAMVVCFTSNNHTTGGNSGSPVLNGKGHLIGINFDRSWESTMSDIMYSKRICRNITLDVRYMLFIIDKFAGAKHLVEEMTLVEKEDPLSIKRKVLQREIEILTSIINSSPNQADLYFKRGKAYYELGKLRESLSDYEKAVSLSPKREYVKQRDFIKNIIKQIESIKE